MQVGLIWLLRKQLKYDRSPVSPETTVNKEIKQEKMRLAVILSTSNC